VVLLTKPLQRTRHIVEHATQLRLVGGSKERAKILARSHSEFEVSFGCHRDGGARLCVRQSIELSRTSGTHDEIGIRLAEIVKTYG
jgi:hypothetical protein